MISTFYFQKNSRAVYNSYYCVTVIYTILQKNLWIRIMNPCMRSHSTAGFNCLHIAHHFGVP